MSKRSIRRQHRPVALIAVKATDMTRASDPTLPLLKWAKLLRGVRLAAQTKDEMLGAPTK